MSDNIASEDSIRPDRELSLFDRPQSRLQSFELWLEDRIEHMSFAAMLFFAFSCWFFTDDAIRLLPIGDNTKILIQQSGIFVIIFLILCSIAIYSLQQRKKQKL